MHGRIKVKTSAEQQEEKRKEREKKSKIFSEGMRQIFEQRYCKDKQMETLKLSEKLLAANPDVYTLWNIRKEIFLSLQGKDETNSLEKILSDELRFLQSCLHANPKSYGVWNQRQFVLKTMKNPNWFEELHLCNLFLKHDERNFHCWDYRRFIVKNSDVSSNEELEYTTKKITDNFSNYSAWHNRSKLLPRVHPDATNAERVEEDVLLKEFHLAQNAFFTDPNDQSAWFYQRWLLGRKGSKPQLLSLSLRRAPLCIIASFSHAVNLTTSAATECMLNGDKVDLKWQSTEEICQKLNVEYSCVWKADISENGDGEDDINLVLSFPEISTCPDSLTLNLLNGETTTSLFWTTDQLTLANDESKMFCDNHTDAKCSVLEGELETLNMLLEEEPDNKWTMLTIVYLMRALDGQKYAKETENLLAKLMQIDSKRTGYYKDLRSKYRIEDKLQEMYEGKISLDKVNLGGMKLTNLHYAQYFTNCNSLDLSGNELSSLTFTPLLLGVETLTLTSSLQNCKELNDIPSFLPHNISIIQ